MTLFKNEFPILEFDDSPRAVIMPNYEDLDIKLPEKCVYAFLGEEINDYALRYRAKKIA